MKRNSQDISEQGFKRYNEISKKKYYNPLPKHLKPATKLYILSYIATLELEKIVAEKKSIGFNHREQSPFKSIPKR